MAKRNFSKLFIRKNTRERQCPTPDPNAPGSQQKKQQLLNSFFRGVE